MVINNDIKETLKEFKINVDDGLLYLLGIYFKLDVDNTCKEETIKAVNLTKIVEKTFNDQVYKWNMPLFEEQQTEWDWVIKGYNKMWDKYPDRKGASKDVLSRMQEWFKKYPEYRKQDVQKATEAYFKTVTSPQYVKNSAKFIFEGVGATKMSHLLAWCEKVIGKNNSSSNLVGKLMK